MNVIVVFSPQYLRNVKPTKSHQSAGKSQDVNIDESEM